MCCPPARVVSSKLMMWPRSLRAWSFSGCQPTGFHIPPAPPPTSPSRPAARPRSGKRLGRALPAVRRCASFHVSMRVPNPSLWPHCASRCWGAHPGVSWTPCRGGPHRSGLDPVHPPGREDRGVGAVAPASRTDRHRAAARVRVPDERVAASADPRHPLVTRAQKGLQGAVGTRARGSATAIECAADVLEVGSVQLPLPRRHRPRPHS